MDSERLFKISKQGVVTYANPAPAKVDELIVQGKIFTYEQLTLPQRQQAKELAIATEKMLGRISEVIELAHQHRTATVQHAKVESSAPNLKIVRNE